MSLADQVIIFKEIADEKRGFDLGYQQGLLDAMEPPNNTITEEAEDPIERLGDTIAKLNIVEAKKLDTYLRSKGVNLIGLA